MLYQTGGQQRVPTLLTRYAYAHVGRSVVLVICGRNRTTARLEMLRPARDRLRDVNGGVLAG
jgi:hypothetical protein